MSEWLDIETVPNDVHEILGCTENGLIKVCERKSFNHITGKWEWFRSDELGLRRTWSIIPKWWMPLPAPPKMQHDSMDVCLAKVLAPPEPKSTDPTF